MEREQGLCVRAANTGSELNPLRADFQSFFGGFRGLLINHLQRLADPFPGTPRHNPGTPNLSWSRLRHKANETHDWVDDDGALAQSVVHCNT
jgi:hypothetical protein